jgi:hypothetical protein
MGWMFVRQSVERRGKGRVTDIASPLYKVDWPGAPISGYHYAVSLETHWRGAGTPGASTRISMQGLKSTLKRAGIKC